MPRPNSHRPFTPDPAQIALTPDISGNDINGLGEADFRQASKVYWSTDTSDIAHGKMQDWFFTVDPGDARFAEARVERQAMLSAAPTPLAPEQVRKDPNDWTDGLNAFVRQGDCEQIGVAVMDPDWVYEGHDIKQSRVIVAGVQHDFDEISTAPAPSAGAEVMAQYNRAMAVSLKIANWLRQQGWAAQPVTGPMTGSLAMIPPALACGFGELGKHGSIINRDMGASFRLSAVLTDAPFAPNERDGFGVDDFCSACQICQDACPPNALFSEKKTVRGTEKWYVDFDACLPFFNEHQGCAICIAVCPWSRPGVGPNLAAKLARRADRLSQNQDVSGLR